MKKLLLLVVLCLSAPAFAAPKVISLTLHTSPSNLELAVWLADTHETRKIGLMHRSDMGGVDGMWFDFKNEKIRHMWMKNTLMPLDMMFADSTGTIRHIITHTVPHSLETLSSREPARYVLEVPAGFVETHTIRIGDRITWLDSSH